MNRDKITELHKQAYELKRQSDILHEQAHELEFEDMLEKLGWKIGDDVQRNRERYHKPTVTERARIIGRHPGWGSAIVAAKYRINGKLSGATFHLYPSEAWVKCAPESLKIEEA